MPYCRALMATKPTALNRIEELQKQIVQLKQEAIDEVKQKLLEARRAVAALEEELSNLTGRPAAPEHRTRRTRRPSITDEALQPQLLKVMAQHGKEGMNAKQLAEKLNQDALRVRKFIKDNGKILKRQGSGPGTKFYLP